MAVAYAGNSGNPVFNGSNTVTVSVPSGIANGDLMIAQIWQGVQTAAAPTNAAWTQAFAVSGNTSQLYLFYRYASSEPANYTFTSSNATEMTGRIHRITGAVTSGNPFNVIGSGDVATAATGITDSAVTTTVANTLAMVFVGHTDGSNAISSYPSGWTAATFTGNSVMATAYLSQSAIGTTGTATTSYTGGSDDFQGVIGAIAPPATTNFTLSPTAISYSLALENVTLVGPSPAALNAAFIGYSLSLENVTFTDAITLSASSLAYSVALQNVPLSSTSNYSLFPSPIAYAYSAGQGGSDLQYDVSNVTYGLSLQNVGLQTPLPPIVCAGGTFDTLTPMPGLML